MTDEGGFPEALVRAFHADLAGARLGPRRRRFVDRLAATVAPPEASGPSEDDADPAVPLALGVGLAVAVAHHFDADSSPGGRKAAVDLVRRVRRRLGGRGRAG